MKKQIQLMTFKGDIGLKGTTHEIEPFYKAIKKACENLVDSSVQGTVRVWCESSDNLATKNWTLTIMCPPLPDKHPLHMRIEGVLAAASFDKRVKSWGQSCTETRF